MSLLQTQSIDVYLKNRAVFPVEELNKHLGNWVAFSPDGSNILDGSKSLAELRKRLVEIHNVDPETVVFERVPTEDMVISGSELS